MAKATLEFYLKRGVVNLEDVDNPDDLSKLSESIDLASTNKHEEAVLHLPQMFFEWIPSNGDGDPAEVFTNSNDFKIDLTPKNSTVRIGAQDGQLVLTISVKFEMELDHLMTEEDLSTWLDENSMYFCGYVGNGWTYYSDDGSSLSVLSVN